MRITLATAVALLAGSAAQGAFISFASDTSPANPTFVSTFDGVTYVRDFGPTNVDLQIDVDENGPAGPITLNANMTAEFTLSFAGTVPLGGSTMAHVFSLSGYFQFNDAAGGMILRADVTNGAFTGVGSSSSIFSAIMSGSGASYTLGSIATEVGFGGVQDGDFGFSLTAINGGAGAALLFPFGDGASPVGIGQFQSEGSFSGRFIPAPGPTALLGIGGLVIARRRR
ncbi:MAG: hypothetical protein AB7G17_05435 [Phycisphaerales bacterium]